MPKRGKGLEIGVGTGRFAVPLGIGTGIDPSKKMIKIARQRGIDARLGYGEHLLFRNSTFDYVVSITTLCFVNDPLKVVREVHRVLKRNGKIYQQKRSIFYKQAKFFSVKEISCFLNEAGFNNLSYYQVLFKLPDKINTIEKPKTGFGKGSFVVISATKIRSI